VVGPDAFRAERFRTQLIAQMGPEAELRVVQGRAHPDELALWLRSTSLLGAEMPGLLWWESPEGLPLKGEALTLLGQATAPHRRLAIRVEKGLAPEGFLSVDASELTGQAWDRLVHTVVGEEGIALDVSGFTALARATHPAGHQVVQACRLLKLAFGDRRLGEQEVERLVRPLEAQALYRLTDALVLRDARAAYRELRDHLERGAEPVMVLGAMSRQMGQLAAFMRAQAEGGSSADAAQSAGLRPFQARTYGRAAAAWSPDELRHWFDRARVADRALKSSRLDAAVWLSALVLLTVRAA
jgi:DNA polymerase III delta subunit